MNLPAERYEDTGIGSVTDELKPGTRLLSGQFTIDSFLNAGGFGITYLARDSLDRRVVVKECFPSSFCRRSGTVVAPRTRQREEDFRSVVRLFIQEALTLSRLEHPNIVKVHQVFEDNETAYMAMEYIDGPDLLEVIEGTAPALSPDQVRAILGQLLEAVGHVHQQGVLHRDISPDNILLERSTGRPVLIDFGASRKDITRKSRALSGLRVVKDGYSPQEFYIGGSLQGPNSDLYALAASFCHLVSGVTPKTSQERLSAIASRQGDPQVPVAGKVKGYSPEFLKAIDKGMSIFPRDRFQSVAEWQAALQTETKRPLLAAVPGLRHQPITAPSMVPVMHPIPAPAATLASAAPARTAAAAEPARLVPVPDPTAAVKAALAAAALDAALDAGKETAPKAKPDAKSGKPAPAPAASRPRAEEPELPVPVAEVAAPTEAPAPQGGGRSLRRVVRNGVLTSAAAVALAAAVLSMPGDLVQRLWAPVSVPLAEGAAMFAPSVVGPVALPNGIVLQTVDTADGTRAEVAALPAGVDTDLRVGDVLLVYAATGEMIESAEAVQALVEKEMSGGITTMGFAVQRDGKMAVGYIGLTDLDEAGLENRDQVLEKKT